LNRKDAEDAAKADEIPRRGMGEKSETSRKSEKSWKVEKGLKSEKGANGSASISGGRVGCALRVTARPELCTGVIQNKRH